MILGKKIRYTEVKNSRQKEIYNFQKVSGVFAEYGWTTIRLLDDWMGADFIAIKFGGGKFLKIQLKGRLTFNKNYQGQDLYICFYERKKDEIKNVYLYPHDKVLQKFIRTIEKTEAWRKNGEFHYPGLSENARKSLKPYIIA